MSAFFFLSVNYYSPFYVLIDFQSFPLALHFFFLHIPIFLSSSRNPLAPSPTRHTCYFFIQGLVIKFDISEGIKYVVWEGEKGALLQSQGQL